jgi:hypothetical protein
MSRKFWEMCEGEETIRLSAKAAKREPRRRGEEEGSCRRRRWWRIMWRGKEGWKWIVGGWGGFAMGGWILKRARMAVTNLNYW